MNLSLAAARGGCCCQRGKKQTAVPPHLHQVVMLQADGQVQRGHEGLVEDIGVGPQVQEAPAALRPVLLHRPVQRHVPLLVAAVQHWPSGNERRANKGQSAPDRFLVIFLIQQINSAATPSSVSVCDNHYFVLLLCEIFACGHIYDGCWGAAPTLSVPDSRDELDEGGVAPRSSMMQRTGSVFIFLAHDLRAPPGQALQENQVPSVGQLE